MLTIPISWADILVQCFISSATMILTRAAGFGPRDVAILRQCRPVGQTFQPVSRPTGKLVPQAEVGPTG